MTLSVRNIGKTILQKFYSPQRFLWQLPIANSSVALTFDDGPDPVYTPAVLDLLAMHRIKATFFVIGEKVVQYPDIVRRIVAEGHAIGNHTWSHREIIGLTPAELHHELSRGRQAIADASGIDSTLFRPPRGRVNLAAIQRVCSQGYCLTHWSKTYSDYKRDGAHNLIARFRQNPPTARDIVLLHDHNDDTVKALATLIPEWLTAGNHFSALAAG